MEKVINEIKVVKTDDGYRIEINADKEMGRWILSGFGLNNFFKDKPSSDNIMETVVNECKVVETDDGYRIEIKGDEEMCRRILSCFGIDPLFWANCFGFGPRFWGKGAWCGDPKDNA